MDGRSVTPVIWGQGCARINRGKVEDGKGRTGLRAQAPQGARGETGDSQPWAPSALSRQSFAYMHAASPSQTDGAILVTAAIQPTTADSDDRIIWGAKNIGRAINRNERQTFALLEGGKIPGAKKIGHIWTVRQRRLMQIWD